MEKEIKGEESLTDKDMAIVFFGELSTKGKNIFDFIRLLGKNIKTHLKAYPQLGYEIHKDHIYIVLNGVPYDQVAKVLPLIPGIHAFAKVKAVAKDFDRIASESIALAKASKAKTFKVFAKRADKTFPMHSDDINRQIGALVLQNVPGIKVDVHEPELQLHIYIRPECAYVYGPKEAGMGGYPLGIAGKVLTLLSGGIDSPVAAYLMMKRGCRIEAIHFAAPPYTSDKVLTKITDLLHVLNTYQPEIKLYVVPFTKLQEEIYEKAGTSYAITIMRRMMLRIAQKVAHAGNDLVISTGESIGQVASQTLKSMSAIDKACDMTVIRPLATYDKTEIIALAQRLGTFDISIRPYDDCCTVFPVKDPVTAPHLDEVEKIEGTFDWNTLVNECVDNVKKIWIKPLPASTNLI